MVTEKRFNYEYFDVYDMGFFLDNGKRMLKDEVLNTLNELHEDNQMLDRLIENRDGWNNLAHDRIFDLEEENGELKQRNDRQAKQLDRLYNIIEEKDWRTLNDILDDFKRCEEQLQREWRTYK